MCNNLRDEQTIIVYNTLTDDSNKHIYEGKVRGMSNELRSLLATASFYLLSDAEDCDVIAVI